MKAIICTTHGKTFRVAGLDLTPEEQEFEITEEQLEALRRAEKPKAFIGYDGSVSGGVGVIRVKVLGAKAKDESKAEAKAEPPPPTKHGK